MITEIELLSTNDAMIWAKAFVEYKNRNKWSLDQIDESLMVSWFANAMAAQEQWLRRSLRRSGTPPKPFQTQ